MNRAEILRHDQLLRESLRVYWNTPTSNTNSVPDIPLPHQKESGPPPCPGCGEPMRYKGSYARGEKWYCAVCIGD